MTEVVILPGLDGTARLLEDFCAQLAGLGVPARAVAYPPDRPMGYEALEDYVLPRLPATPFVLLGESFSGPLAIRVASRAPAGLVGLALSTTFARAPVTALVPLASLVRFAPARPPAAMLEWSLLGPWATPALKSALAGALRQVRPEVLRTRAAAALRVDASDRLARIGVPVLQFLARQDRLLSRSACRTLVAGLPQSHGVTLDGPHLLLQTAAQRCAREVVEFVGRLGAVAPPPAAAGG